MQLTILGNWCWLALYKLNLAKWCHCQLSAVSALRISDQWNRMNNSLLAVKWVESFLHIDCMDISLKNDVNSSKPLFVVLLLLLILISVLLLSDYQLTAAEQTKNELSNKNKTILELIAKENSCQWGLIVFVSILISAFPIKIGCCFFNSSVIFQFFCLSHSNADSFFAENKYVLWISVQSSYRNKKPLFKFFVSWIRCYVAMY